MTKKSFFVTSPSGVVTNDGVFHAAGSTIFAIPASVTKLLENGSITNSNNISSVSTKQEVKSHYTWRGDWAYNVTYQLNNCVTFNGISYIAVISNINKMPPSDQWQQLKI
jgi:hypothetical protein